MAYFKNGHRVELKKESGMSCVEIDDTIRLYFNTSNDAMYGHVYGAELDAVLEVFPEMGFLPKTENRDTECHFSVFS